jgi:predicted adenylyl cyclase CyaB
MSLSRRNLELKASLADPATAHQVAQRLCGSEGETQRQCDTYFHCPSGRLKLREIQDSAPHLIFYDRGDSHQARLSHYELVPVVDADLLKQALAAALGIRCIVQKRRQIYLYRNVRIHLDEVQGLGAFLEFEAVLGPDDSLEEAQALLEDLRGPFGIGPSATVDTSYGDLMTPGNVPRV